MKNKQTKFIVGALVVFGAIGYLMYAGIKETSVYYLTVTEAQASPVLASGQDFRMEGSVLAGSIKKSEDSLSVDFIITDESKEIPVRYAGTIPDMFDDGIDVVVQGAMDKKTGVFQAHTLLTSCPSKYEASEQEGKV